MFSGKYQVYGSLYCLDDSYKSFCMAMGDDTVKARAAGGDEFRSHFCLGRLKFTKGIPGK